MRRSQRMFFCNLLNVATEELTFMFNNKFYKRIDGVAKGCALSPAVANIFKCIFENPWLQKCPRDLKPVVYRWYVDDLFVLPSSLDK